MKKIVFILSVAVLTFVSCSREMREEPAPTQEKTVLTVTSAETKTTIGDKVGSERQLYWSNKDKVCVNGIVSEELSGISANTVTSADFTFGSSLETPYNTVYPSTIWKDASTVILPRRASSGVIPLAGTSSTAVIPLQALTSVLKISLKLKSTEPDTDKISFIEVSTESTRLSGVFSIDFDKATLNPAPSPTGDDLKVWLSGSWTLTADPTEFFIPVPEGTYSITVKVRDINGHYMTKSTTSDKTFTKGSILALAAFEFDPTGDDKGIEIDSAEKLIDFANKYNNNEFADYGADLLVTLTDNITFVDSDNPTVLGSYAAFNATNGIGTKDNGSGDTNYFNGLFNGNNHKISGLEATAPLFAYVGANGRIEDLTLTETCSLVYNSAISEDKSLGAIAGYSEGDLFNCVNKAPVSCSSTRTAGVLNIGGVVGRQYAYGTISNCVNYASVTCTVGGSSDIYMGGIAGTVERPNSEHTALIENCTNYGNVKNGLDESEPAQSCVLHIGGVVGWIYSSSSSASMEISGLINTGNVTKTNNSARADGKAVLVGGIVGGIHGASISDRSGQVAIKNSHVNNCRVQTGNFNNSIGYGEASQIGGFVAVARGHESTKNISFSDDCYVKDVYVICRRGFAGGFVSWARGAVFSECQVLRSSVRGSLANCYFAGGIAGCAYDCNLSDCTVLLTKEDSAGNSYDSYTLYARGNNNMAGGIVAQARGTVSIDGCKAYVKKMVQGDADKDAYRGWIVGYIEDNAEITIKDCAIGGSSSSATAVTLDADNFDDDYNGHTYGYYYGSKGSNGAVTFTGTQFYWEAIKTADITISSYATSHGWEANSFYSIEQGDVTLTPSDNGGSQNGAYNTQWRFYQARGGGLTISVSGGHSLVKATFTYNYTNTGVLLAPDGSTQIASGGSCDLSGTSAFFTIGNTGEATNGQVRFTKIVVEYE